MKPTLIPAPRVSFDLSAEESPTRSKPRTCTECGGDFRGANRRCGKCLARDRVCACGKSYRGRHLLCSGCRSKDRVCECGTEFRGEARKCPSCVRSGRSERQCAECGAPFKGKSAKCSRCRTKERECGTCGKAFRGSSANCWSCRRTERACKCGRVYWDYAERGCPTCNSKERVCSCGRTYRGTNLRCRVCVRAAIPFEERTARDRAGRNIRRARKLAGQISGRLSVATYQAVRRSGPCVYCGGSASTVDHVTPLARGGLEEEANLVPACKDCNFSKNDRLLTEWDPTRVRRAVLASAKVARALLAQDPDPWLVPPLGKWSNTRNDRLDGFFANVALKLHDAGCRACASPNSDFRCPRGELLSAATNSGGDPDLPGYLTDLAYPAL